MRKYPHESGKWRTGEIEEGIIEWSGREDSNLRPLGPKSRVDLVSPFEYLTDLRLINKLTPADHETS